MIMMMEAADDDDELSYGNNDDDGTDDDAPSIDEPGAYFFVFSICHRPDSAQFITSANSPGAGRTRPR